MFDFIKKKKKKVHDKWFLLIFSTLVVCIGIGNELLKGTSALDETLGVPSNSAFDDISFYMCVVDAYNSENDTDLEYDVNLTDEQLLSITYLNCSVIGNGLDDVAKIKSTKGIEKLTSLVEIQLFKHEITSINFFDNPNLEYIQLKGNKLTSIDVSNNEKLLSLDVSENYLTRIDVSNNILLQELIINNNNLDELDLTNNNNLDVVVSTYNNFSKNINLYKDDSIILDSVKDIIKLPSEMNYDLFNWILLDYDDSDIVSVEGNLVETLNGGSVQIYGGIDHEDFTNTEEDISFFLIDTVINVIDIFSDEYTISKEEDFVYIGNGNIDLNKLDIVKFNLDVNNNKLQIKNESLLITELDILSIDFGRLDISNKIINISSKIDYEDFITYINKSNELSLKIINEEDVVTQGNIVGGEKIEIYYKELLLDTYEIKNNLEINNDLIFDNKIIIDKDNSYIKYKGEKISVFQFLKSVTGYKDARIFVSDIAGNEKNENDLVVTGDTLTVFVGSEKKEEYKIAVRGDANGDGKVSSSDLVQIRKHIVGWLNPKTGIKEKKIGIYLYAIDMNDDNKITSLDLVRMRKVIVGIDIDE